jgi:hypothetical protein
MVVSGTTFGTDTLKNVSEALKKNITGIQAMVEDIDKQFSTLAKTIGAGREQAFLLKQTLTEGLTEITRLGGSVADIVKQQEALFATFGTQLVLNKNATDELFATTQATGIESKDLFTSYANLGKSIYEANSEMASIMENANLIGVNAKEVAKSVNANMSALSKINFKDGVMGLADMAAKSAMLRVDMSTALKSAEDLYKPEKAQSFVNTLQRLGATGSSELMNVERVRFLARNEPAKLQEEIAKMASKFVDETGKMSAIGMDFLKEIASESGYSADELSKMGISMSQLKDKQDLINQTGLQLTDPKEMEKLTNLLTKGKDGKFEVTYEQDGQQVTKALEDMNSYERDQLQKFLQSQNDQIKNTFQAKPGEDKNLVKLIEQQMDVNTKFTQAIKALETVIPSQIAGSKTGEKMIQSIIDNTNKLSTTALTKLDELSDEAGKAVDMKIKIIESAVDAMKPTLQTVVDTMETLATNTMPSLTSAANRFTTALGNVGTFLTNTFKLDDFVSLPGNDRLIMGPEGSIGRINSNDTIISSTDGPKTEEEVAKMMELIKSPQTPLVSSPIETKPILTSENLGTKSMMEIEREKALTDIMMSQTPKTSETPTEIKTTNDINHKLDIVVDLKNVPTNINQNELKGVIENVVLKPEFVNNIKMGLEKIKGVNYY